MSASSQIPHLVADKVSDRAKETLDILSEGAQRWSTYPPIIDDLKARAKKLGLWNIFLSKTHYTEGAGFTNLEYGLIAEQLGRSQVASEVRRTFSSEAGGEAG
ncbi:hypothetical protein GP486_006170 [Trichoglossum hirsutum]|uniref:Acyl-CoA dehydrogenase/oxidase N-terminal domain-containing protein n=1 Tax=Trichoglossum hirsutum TaxID=265104 RepID=A0A9P8IE63_9PEZI|nr:hypothetical protein GP486_006170 [Trichoglossum hirsutum]